jgi:hypothetical protein
MVAGSGLRAKVEAKTTGDKLPLFPPHDGPLWTGLGIPAGSDNKESVTWTNQYPEPHNYVITCSSCRHGEKNPKTLSVAVLDRDEKEEKRGYNEIYTPLDSGLKEWARGLITGQAEVRSNADGQMTLRSYRREKYANPTVGRNVELKGSLEFSYGATTEIDIGPITIWETELFPNYKIDLFAGVRCNVNVPLASTRVDINPVEEKPTNGLVRANGKLGLSGSGSQTSQIPFSVFGYDTAELAASYDVGSAFSKELNLEAEAIQVEFKPANIELTAEGSLYSMQNTNDRLTLSIPLELNLAKLGVKKLPSVISVTMNIAGPIHALLIEKSNE